MEATAEDLGEGEAVGETVVGGRFSNDLTCEALGGDEL